MFESDAQPPDDYRVARTPWTVYLGFVLLVLAVVGIVVFATSPAPYVIEKPGPVFNTLGQVENANGDEVPLIDIPQETTYPTSGTLDLLTVYLDGSPQTPVSWIDVALAWFNPSRSVVPLDAVFPPGQTDEEANQESAQQMNSSQQDAVAAALTELDIPYTSTLAVAQVIDGTPADGVLKAGDELLSAGGVTLDNVDDLRAQLKASGVGVPIELGIRRDGVEQTVTLSPQPSPQDGSATIGIYPGTTYEFPIDVNIQLNNVGGPSAGMMFALGIYDKLTPGELTGGAKIAGTGTIDGSGTVGPIGGIVQKMYGASAAGAEWFLAPEENCSEVVGHIPGGIQVFSVSTLDEAVTSVEAIAKGDTSSLATCHAEPAQG
ncbi:MAG: PDZ domain-containing protein [Pseudolysinimonas sp.]|uniref:YlbL family protein n=1 Tax=Pseudolysinimonas sp. TaxID=2680009 RepID=UPI00326472E7